MAEQAKMKPSRWFYVLGVGVILLGATIFSFVLNGDLEGISHSLTRFIMPGSKTLDLPKAGEYTIYYERQSVVDNRVFSTEGDLHGIVCDITSNDAGTTIPLSSSTGSFSYNFGEISGAAVFNFRVSQPGTYVFSAHYPRGTNGGDIVMAVGPDVTARFTTMLMFAMLSFFGGIGIGGTILWFTRRKRRKFSITDAREYSDSSSGSRGYSRPS